MSKSRLEKFLYALYSLDSSDLPNPLSRIEELYKCLVTGDEAPTFEPLSRVEKYLMAILGSYDVELLPNPLSRVEVLLYKLATGDDNLDDFKSFLSEHEELLAEIIRNGGAGGNIDIEYVLYTLSTEFNTLYNTAEKPIKSAILKGQTLITNYCSGIVEITATGSWVERPVQLTEVTLPVKPSTDYLFVVEIIENSLIGDETINNSLRFGETEGTGRFPAVFKSISAIPLHQLGMYRFILTTKADISGIDIFDRKQLSKHCTGGKIKFRYMVIEYQKGMENWDIPYFEGMQSVKMPVLTTTGKNLFNVGTIKKGYTLSSNKGLEATNPKRYTSDFIYVKGLTHIAITNPERNHNIWGYDENKQPVIKLNEGGISGNFVISIPSNITYVRIPFSTINQDDITDEIVQNILVQVEAGKQISSYEPHKSNILTVNEDITLRGVGYVKDTLDLIGGELTQCVGEVVLNGQEKWRLCPSSYQPTDINYISYDLDVNNIKTYAPILCDTIKVRDWAISSKEINSRSIAVHSTSKFLRLCIEKTIAPDVETLKKYLSTNMAKVQYQLATESIKTVDLSVVNQDGNDTKLSTFNDITHVTLSSEGLIPEAELKVATKNEEVLNTMSLEMDDIFTTQNALKETSNTQSENVDATMIATTEIYEGLL